MSARVHLNEIAALNVAGWSFTELAEAYGTTRNAIAGMLGRAGVRTGRGVKLRADQAAEIRRRCDAGENRQRIADDVGVCVNTVYLINSGRSWNRAA